MVCCFLLRFQFVLLCHLYLHLSQVSEYAIRDGGFICSFLFTFDAVDCRYKILFSSCHGNIVSNNDNDA